MSWLTGAFDFTHDSFALSGIPKIIRKNSWVLQSSIAAGSEGRWDLDLDESTAGKIGAVQGLICKIR